MAAVLILVGAACFFVGYALGCYGRGTVGKLQGNPPHHLALFTFTELCRLKAGALLCGDDVGVTLLDTELERRVREI